MAFQPAQHRLSRRERQIMDALYRLGSGAVGDVQSALPDPPGYSAVRTHMRILEQKGYVRHVEDGGRYVYSPVEPRQIAARSALRQVVQNFFAGSVERVVAALLSPEETSLTEQQLSRLAGLIEKARAEGGDKGKDERC